MDFQRAHHDAQLIGANTLREEPHNGAGDELTEVQASTWKLSQLAPDMSLGWQDSKPDARDKAFRQASGANR